MQSAKRGLADHQSVEHGFKLGMDAADTGNHFAQHQFRVHSAPVVHGYCLPGHRLLHEPEYGLWLKDHLPLHDVKNAALAPGYLKAARHTGTWIE